MPPFNLSQLQSTPTPEPEARAPAHAKGASTVEEPTKTPTERLLKGWGVVLQSLEVCTMAAPDHKPDPFGVRMHGRALSYLCIIVRTI